MIAEEEWYTPLSQIPSIVQSKRLSANSGICHDISFRKAQINALINMIDENYDTFKSAIHADLGQNNFFTKMFDVGSTVSAAKFVLSEMDEWVKTKAIPTSFPVNTALPFKSTITPTPRGVILNISPWNFPFALALVPVLEAIAAGNVCIIKPSEHSMNCSKVMARLLPQYVDPRVVSVVLGGAAHSTELLKHRFDAIVFTGSTEVGKVVATAAAQHLTPTLLELGGKSPAIVCDDADLESAAMRIALSKFTANMGQFCCASDYVIVVESKKEKFVELLKQALVKFYGIDPKQSQDVGRMISIRHTERLVRLLEDPTIQIVHGGKYDVKEKYIEPTIVEAGVNSECMKEEIFGPILPIYTVPTTDDAVNYVQDHYTFKGKHPLALYVFSKSEKKWKHIINCIQCGGASINDPIKHIGNKFMPFGGVGTSGMNSYHGRYGFDFFSHYKPVMSVSNYSTNPADPGVWLLFPPYTEQKMKAIVAMSNLPDFCRKVKAIFRIVMPAVILGIVFQYPGIMNAILEFNIKTIINAVLSMINCIGNYLK
mmetsp:Transcript_39103/g.57086  ORF Transcript_39103/g.57086 Transcript_39103/m.57086 type:complete len:542 (-) Transcript_39103:541-2166(-)